MMNSLSDFTNIEYINKGQHGSIYKAIFKRDNKVYAIKKIIEIKKLNDDYNNYINYIKMLIENISHPNIIKYFSFFIENNYNYFVLEFFEGDNLENLSNKYKFKNQYIPEALIIIILKGVISGLLYLHNKKIMHRDIAPDNIIINKNNEVKITDFGISKKLKKCDLNEFSKGTATGKNNYASPEIYKAFFNKEYGTYTFKTDVFSLGVTMFYLMTFNFPFDVNTINKKFSRNNNIINPKFYNHKLIALVERMLTFDENLRPSSFDLYNEIFNLKGNNNNMNFNNLIKQKNENNIENYYNSKRSAFFTVILYFYKEDKIKDYFGNNLFKSKIDDREKISSDLSIVINSFAEVLSNFKKKDNRLNSINEFIIKTSQKILIFKDEDITPKLIIDKLFEYFHYFFYKLLNIFNYNNKNAYILFEKLKKMPSINKGFIEKINEFKINYANIFSDTFYFPILKRIQCPCCDNIIEEKIEIIYYIDFPQYEHINKLLEHFQNKNKIINNNNIICEKCCSLPIDYIEIKSFVIAPNILIFHFRNSSILDEYIEIKEYFNPNKILYKLDAIINLNRNNHNKIIYNVAINNKVIDNWLYYDNGINNNVSAFNEVIKKGEIYIAFYKIFKDEDKNG